MRNKNKAKVKGKEDNGVKKKLTKSQKKKLEKVLERRRKKANISDLLDELKKHQLTDEEYSKLTPRFGSKSKGFRQTSECKDSAAKIYSSGKKKRNSGQNESMGSINCSTSFKVLDLELSSSDDNEDDEEESNDKIDESSSKTNVKVDVEMSTDDQEIFKKIKRRKIDKEDSDVEETIKPDNILTTKSIDSKFVPLNRSDEINKSRNKLPIIAEESNIIDEIKNNPVVIICGETGSGKTTQLPQFLYEHGFAEDKKIVITQPRRVAAISMSKRVAHEMNLGEDVVSFQIRHEGNVTEKTKIKFVTDGVLMKELQKDILLSSYSIVIIDEAHERSIHSDILIGLISRIIKLREQRGEFFRLVIMSATLRVSDFTENTKLFKVPPPIINIQTRQFPIQIHFSKKTPDDYLKEAYKKVCKIHKEQSLNGGILVFVTGRREVLQLVSKLKQTFPFTNNSNKIEGEEDLKDEKVLDKNDKLPTRKPTAATKIKDLIPEIDLDNFTAKPNKSLNEELSDQSDSDASDSEEMDSKFEIEKNASAHPLYCLPLYSMLPEKEQSKVFEQPPENSRLCVIATNVAETSLTIPNIKYVIDTGKLKNKFYDKTTGIYTHLIDWCAKSSANQRSGRSGRSGPGICYRLYSSAVYNDDFKEFPDAEILKKPLDDLVLQLKSMYIEKIPNFPFPTVPDLSNIEATEKRLIMLGALKPTINIDKKEESVLITSLGKIISTFPVSPRYGKMLAIAIQQDLLDYAIAIVSLLTIQEIFVYSDQQDEDKEDQENEDDDVVKIKKSNESFNIFKKKWMLNTNTNLGDIMLMLRACFASELNGNKLAFCKFNNLRHKAMIEVHKLRRLLVKEISSNFEGIKLTADLNKIKPPNDEQSKKLQQLMLICFCDHIGKRLTNDELSSSEKLKKIKNAYRSIELEDPVFLHDKTVLKDQKPEWIVYQEMFENGGKMLMRNVVAIDSNWIPIYAKEQCKFSKPLEQPAPFYDKGTDHVKCFVMPTVCPFAWKLKQTAIEYPETTEKYKLFAQFLLEGKVFNYFIRFNTDKLYLSNPNVLTKPWGFQKEPNKVLNVLIENRISTKAALSKKFKLKPSFLLSEFLNCVLEREHEEIRISWPPKD